MIPLAIAAPSAVVKVTRASHFPASAVPPEAQRILQEYREAKRLAETAVERALIVGQLLAEQRYRVDGAQSFNNGKPENSKFAFWLEKYCPEIPRATAYRYMQVAERVMEHTGLRMLITNTEVPLSMALTAPEAELPKQAREWRQTVFAFVANKTMKECLAGVVVEGNEAHSITRAHNGRTMGGTRGENRKNFVKFTALKLRHITTFVTKKLSPVEEGKIIHSFDAAMQQWPKKLIKAIAEIAVREGKMSDEERAGRSK